MCLDSSVDHHAMNKAIKMWPCHNQGGNQVRFISRNLMLTQVIDVHLCVLELMENLNDKCLLANSLLILTLSGYVYSLPGSA